MTLRTSKIRKQNIKLKLAKDFEDQSRRTIKRTY